MVGLADIVHRELNFPIINGSFTKGVQVNEGANSGPASVSSALEYQIVGIGIGIWNSEFLAVTVLQGSSGVAKRSQSYPDYSSLHQFREVQRRMV